jgi:serine/threonine protein kinase
MIPPQPADDLESADDTAGSDHCTLLDEYWDALRGESRPDLRQRLIDRDPTGDSIARDLDFLNLLHRFRSVLLAGNDASQNSTTRLSEPFATNARSRPSGSEAGASSGMKGQATVDDPRQIGKYRVLEKLGSGGQAQVYRVVHPNLAMEYALKLYRRPTAMEDHAGRDEMLREGRLLVHCEHPNLVRVIDLDVHEGRWFVVMEYVPGLTLARCVAKCPPTPRLAARYVIELAQAVAYLHTRGITHQDIKPQNVLIDDRGRPRLIDFGLARLMHGGRDGADDWIGGTVGYMSPEQAKGRVDLIGHRTDVFGLGGLLYHMLTGRRLYLGSTPDSTLRFARKAAYVPVRQLNPRVPRSLERICHKALAADPERRYPTTLELERILRRSLERRRSAAAGLAVSSLVASVLFVLRPSVPSSAPRDGPSSPPVAPKIDFNVEGFRDEPLESLGTIGLSPETIHVDDSVRVSARLDTPMYCYVIALNSNGDVQWCYPPLGSKPPSRSESISFPPEATDYFALTDGPGLQGFVLLAMTEPLTSFEKWEGIDGLRRRWEPASGKGVWSYDGHWPERVDSVPRGEHRNYADPPPGFQEVCKYLTKLSGIVAIRVIAFPVKPKNQTEEDGCLSRSME